MTHPLATVLGLADDLELEILRDYEAHGALATDTIVSLVKREAARRRNGERPITGAMIEDTLRS